eukprot:TRINITY_DN1326_c0_g1_i2.p2 TRINITY_DN1326_c0_g1~~TRINITY_DN1326_c0_g1_i2.p2  ORF type:complete len:184 (+),score=98.31 TRINITY_DN1326_c0_g1_i2:85-636(+)
MFDCNKQVAFYAAYHNDKVNQWIHITCIPMILWTALVFTSEVEVPMLGEALGLGYPVPLSWVAAAGYATFYLMLDLMVGGAWLPILGMFAITSTDFVKENENAYPIAITVHVVAWIAQFIGHGVFEKRAPALLDSFVQALVMAPFFVGMEIAFMAGLKQQQKEDVKKLAMEDIMAFRKAQKLQ